MEPGNFIVDEQHADNEAWLFGPRNRIYLLHISNCMMHIQYTKKTFFVFLAGNHTDTPLFLMIDGAVCFPKSLGGVFEFLDTELLRGLVTRSLHVESLTALDTARSMCAERKQEDKGPPDPRK